MAGRRRRLAVLCVLVAPLLLPTAAAGQTDDPESQVRPVAGARIGAPQKLSAYLGADYVVATHRHGYAGISLLAEPGLGGGRLAVGLSSVGYGTFRLQAAVLRTWGDPWAVAAGQTFVGPEAVVTFLAVGIGVGAYARTAGDHPGDGYFLAASLVVGL